MSLNSFSTRFCSCPNQHHLAAGDECEICLGVVPEWQLPDLQFEPAHEPIDECYGPEYFEDLELHLKTVMPAA